MPAMSSAAMERIVVWPALPEGNIVAWPTVECPSPSACPYSWHITPSMSQRCPISVGPSSHVQLSQKRMRQPSEIGVSVKARVLAEQLVIADTMLLFDVPMPFALPAHMPSKLAPPLPSRLLLMSPLPSPCSRLPHSTTPFQIASPRPAKAGDCVPGTALSSAVAAAEVG